MVSVRDDGVESATGPSRPFGFWTATALVVGGMIGAGIFVLPAQLAPFGATGAVGWLFAVAGAIVIAWVLAQLFAARPAATGAMELCAEGIGQFPTLLVAWSYWVSTWCANAVLALTTVRYLAVLWPWLGSSTAISAAGALVVLWALTLFNLNGARAVGQLQVLTTVLKLLPLLAVLVIIAMLAVTDPARFTTHPHPAFDIGQLTPALGLAFYALVGLECAGLAAERVRDPKRNVRRATMAGVAVTGLIYVIVSTGIAYALPQHPLQESGAPVALFVSEFWGTAAGSVIAAFAMISALGCLNGFVLLLGEIPLSMARAGLLPRWMGRTSSRDVPVGAIVLAAVLASVLILSNLTRSLGDLMSFMLLLASAATIWLYVGVCASALVLKVARIPAAIGLAFSAWTLIGSGIEALAWSVVLMVTAVPLYFIARRGVTSEKPA